MRSALRPVAVLAGFGLAALAGLAPATLAQEELGGLPAGPGQEETYYNCNACHSIRLVSQQRLSRERWDQILDEMVEKQGMPPLPDDERALVLGYLAEHLNPGVPR
jgi:mono/diheme cytochrome c family protein